MANYDNRSRGDREAEQLKKLFIGGLTSNITEDELKQHFGQWGELVDVVVMKDKASGRSRGFGFVTYKDEASVDDAQNNRPHVLDNKEVDTKRAMPRGESSKDESHVRVEKLFVGGLRPETTEQELQDYFSSYGEVVSAEIAKMRDTGKPRGFAFITFKDYDAVDKAILYKPHNLGSSERVDCKKALSKEQLAEVKARQQAAPYNVRGGFAGGRGGYGGGYGAPVGGYGGGYGGYGAPAGGYGGVDSYGNGGYAGGYADGGYGGGYGDGAGYGAGGYAGGADMAGYSEGGEGAYGNGAGFGSYGGQGYAGGPAKPPMGGFGGGPQRFQPYGGGARGRGGAGGRGGFRGRGAY